MKLKSTQKDALASVRPGTAAERRRDKFVSQSALFGCDDEEGKFEKSIARLIEQRRRPKRS